MTRYAIGDVQGCYAELRALIKKCGFSADRDVLWFVGDLVNRGPQSLEVLRYVRGLGDNAIVVLGNHDLHLLARAFGTRRKSKSGDTIDDVLSAPDRDRLLEWLITRPLVHHDPATDDVVVHAGLIPQWSLDQALSLSREIGQALRKDARSVFDNMYGDEPNQWRDDLAGMDRFRFAINVFTRMRVCTPEGRIDPRMKGPPDPSRLPFRPWFEHEHRRTRAHRIIFGHWSALGFINAHGVVGLDTGCVWGGRLTAFDLDRARAPISTDCSGYREIGED